MKGMNVVTINASPLMDKGNTAAILTPFLDGMREMGADVEVYYTRKLNIKPCQGDYNCQFKTPGKCFQQDDMAKLMPKIANADIQVFATPVYFDGMAGPMKMLLDRLIPLTNFSFELRDGHCRHPLRQGNASGKMVLVSNCGFWEKDNFGPLLVHMKAICRNMNRQFAGALLRPHGPFLKHMAYAGAPVNDIFQAAREAGRQLIREGVMSDRHLATVSRDLVPLEEYMQRANQLYENRIAKLAGK